MDLKSYQAWVRAFDRARGWDLCTPAETFVHFSEEVGEIARCVLGLEGYRPLADAAEMAGVRAHLQEEIADAVTFLVKLAYLYDVEVDDGLVANQTKCEGRYPPASAPAAVAEYLRAHRAELDRYIDEYQRRFDGAIEGREEPKP